MLLIAFLTFDIRISNAVSGDVLFKVSLLLHRTSPQRICSMLPLNIQDLIISG